MWILQLLNPMVTCWLLPLFPTLSGIWHYWLFPSSWHALTLDSYDTILFSLVFHLLLSPHCYRYSLSPHSSLFGPFNSLLLFTLSLELYS